MGRALALGQRERHETSWPFMGVLNFRATSLCLVHLGLLREPIVTGLKGRKFLKNRCLSGGATFRKAVSPQTPKTAFTELFWGFGVGTKVSTAVDAGRNRRIPLHLTLDGLATRKAGAKKRS